MWYVPYSWVHYDQRCHLVFMSQLLVYLYAQNCHISTSGLKADVTIVFLGPISYMMRELRRFANISGRNYWHIIFAWIFRTFCHKMAVSGKIGEETVRCWPPTNSFLLLGVVTSVPLLAKVDQEMRESAHRQTDTQTHTRTKTNWIYNLSGGICCSCGADNKNVSKLTNATRYVTKCQHTLVHRLTCENTYRGKC